ncbi:DUF1349 domain-containing protein [Pseudonocardia lacus]|uniref:DUF1349 domain-containing protein n=1 Tax=Pseudonocardia lacus TaxID=2835865 RepID=UPI001BDC20BD|nr:DUF1349 domain-containing protein [Pseudonocardia lacus]
MSTRSPVPLVRREWTAFRTRRRLLAVAAAVLVTVSLGLLVGLASRTECGTGPSHDPGVGPCPTAPLGPDGRTVRDEFTFVHRPLGEQGSITVRLTSMTGIITYPPPDHDEIVEGMVPWAKAGVIVKDGLAQGSTYAALMVTAGHGVRMQHDFTEDVAGGPGGVSEQSPRWLRLTRSGDTITGHESVDGVDWTEVGTAHLPGLPATARVGLFAASPGDLTLRAIGLGASLPEMRFTQTTATFDSISVDGSTEGPWTTDTVGRHGLTDWEKFRRAPGLVESGTTFTVTGSGDMAVAGHEAGRPVEDTLLGLPIGLAVLVVVAARFTTRDRPRDRSALAAKAALVGAVGFAAGLLAAGITVPVGVALLHAGGNPVLATPTPTVVRMVLGVAALHAVAAVLAVAVAARLRRAALLVPAALVLPYILATVPLLPDAVADALLTATPAAGFAVRQTVVEHPHVSEHFSALMGYFPLPWWAGLGVLIAFTAPALASAFATMRKNDLKKCEVVMGVDG